MPAKVVFHLPAKQLKTYRSRAHLRVFDRIQQEVEIRGGHIRAVRRDPRLIDPSATDWRAVLDDGNLHIIENGQVRHPNALNTALAYIPPFWHLDGRGVLCNSSIAERVYDPRQVRLQPAKAFFQQQRRRLVGNRRSRYNQKREYEAIPEGAIAVFLQGENPEKQGSTHCTAREMLRAVAQGAENRPVVVKPHPLQPGDAAMVQALKDAGLDFILTDANIHDILSECAVTVSFNSAVSIEGYLHRKPAILFGRSDFHHMAETVEDPADFPVALQNALARKGGYAKYFYWYFALNCLSVQGNGFADRMLAIFGDAGFAPERLGLDWRI